MQNKVNVYEAINYFTKRHKHQKEFVYEIIISLLGISYSLFKIYLLKKKNDKIYRKLNELSIQQAYTPKEFKEIHEALKAEGIYSEQLYLKNQHEKKDKVHYYKNIYLQGEMMGARQQNYLGIVDLSYDSNEYFCNLVPNHRIRKMDSGFKKYQFSGCPLNMSGTVKYECDTKLPINVDANNSMGKWYVANQLISLILGRERVWIKGLTIPVTINAWFEPSQKFVIGCDVVLTKGSIRISKLRSIGKTFSSLRYELNRFYKYKIELNKLSIQAYKLGLAICLISLTYFGAQKIKTYLTRWAYSREYPRIDEVKAKFKQAYLLIEQNQQSKFLICKTCEKNLIDLVFIPCYHMQSCQKCLQTQGMIICEGCNKVIYSGIPVFTNT